METRKQADDESHCSSLRFRFKIIEPVIIIIILGLFVFPYRSDGAGKDHRDFETQLIEKINTIRAEPESYIPILDKFKNYFRGNTIVFPGNIRTFSREGTRVVDEAISYLKTVKPARSLAESPCLSASASDHHRDQMSKGGVGHRGSDGSMPDLRIKRRCGGKMKKTGESISYGMYAGDTPEAVVVQLVVDDGVANRLHRAALFDDRFKYIGVACGSHPGFGFMCVIDTAGD